MLAAPSPLDRLRERLGTRAVHADEIHNTHSLPLGWPAFDAALPDGGLPHGVVELRASRSLGGGTMVALAAIHGAQKADARAWCAWVDPAGSLYAPGVVMAGVELHRLLVLRPQPSDVGRVAIKLARSGAFSVIVVDGDAGVRSPGARPRHDRSRDVVVRKLALLAAEEGATILLLTDSLLVRPSPLPAALRLDLVRGRDTIDVRIGKDRYGRGGLARTVPLQDRPFLHLVG